MTLYSDLPISEIGPNAANAIEYFLAAIPAGTLRTFLANNGYHKILTAAKVKKDLKELRAMDSSYKGHRLEYTEGIGGDVGTFAVRLDAAQPSPGAPALAQCLRFDFPHEIVIHLGADRMVDLICELAVRFPYSSGSAGYSFNRSGQDEVYEAQEVNAMLKRYSGFEAGDPDMWWYMRGCTPRPQWLNLVGPVVASQLGGIEAIRLKLPDCEFRQVGGGWMIRSARLPIIGDENRRATDIGCLPDVARALSATRVKLNLINDDPEVFDLMKWLAAFDERTSKDWENG